MSGVGILGGSGVDGFATSGGAGGTEFADDVFRIQDDADPTKELAFQVSGVGAGTTRTLTAPPADGHVLATGTQSYPAGQELDMTADEAYFTARSGGTLRFTTSGSGVVEFFSGDDTTIDAGNRIFATANNHIFLTVDNNTAGEIGLEAGTGTGGVIYLRADRVRFNTNGWNAYLDGDLLTTFHTYQFPDGDGILGLRVDVPATASSAGEPGMWASDGSHAYFCHATDTWVRVAVGSW
jgi:hypothetical protein